MPPDNRMQRTALRGAGAQVAVPAVAVAVAAEGIQNTTELRNYRQPSLVVHAIAAFFARHLPSVKAADKLD